jgi:hypothetical protein
VFQFGFPLTRQDILPRYYKALYGRLVALEVLETSKPSLLISLLYKSLLQDTDVVRMLAMAKVMLQLCFHQAPNVICAILYTLSLVCMVVGFGFFLLLLLVTHYPPL